MFFGTRISVEKAPDVDLRTDDNEKRPLVKDFDEYHPNSSRTLYVGNLENRGLTRELLQNMFAAFGQILVNFFLIILL